MGREFNRALSQIEIDLTGKVQPSAPEPAALPLVLGAAALFRRRTRRTANA